jgi:hypothetical protein
MLSREVPYPEAEGGTGRWGANTNEAHGVIDDPSVVSRKEEIAMPGGAHI